MLLSPENLTAHLASKDDTRGHLQTLLVEKEQVISTDGHRLLSTPTPPKSKTSLFPTGGAPEGFDAETELGAGEAVVIPIAQAAKIAKQIPQKKSDLEGLKFAALDVAATQANGHVEIGTTDLESFTVNRVKKDLEATGFPNWRQVVPDGERKIVEIGFNAAYMAELCTQIAKASSSTMVKLELHCDSSMPQSLDGPELAEQLRERTNINPMRLSAKNPDGQEVWAILMPARV